ncbi:MAG: 4Fe-4S dicluster domain-containing protein [candidate division NC10 bacterium]|nr:4Fe-4S dicluster domain-containing protein [candidate division NC10 bacterium]
MKREQRKGPHRISDFYFYREISALPSGREILKCIQCGTCSASCPVFRYNPGANPRKIIAKAILGMKEEVIRSEEIWLCAKCESCLVRCHKDVRPGEILGAIRTIAIRKGVRRGPGPQHTRAFRRDILRFGKLNEATLPLVTLGYRMIKMVPLALRMLARGKLPSPLPKRTRKIEQVRALFDRFGEEPQ